MDLDGLPFSPARRTNEANWALTESLSSCVRRTKNAKPRLRREAHKQMVAKCVARDDGVLFHWNFKRHTSVHRCIMAKGLRMPSYNK